LYLLASELVQEDLPLNTWSDDSVEIEITHCSLCASDMHFIKSSWFPVEYPLVAGHEFTGIVTRVGANVSHLKVGDRAGAGPLCHSCNHCNNCEAGDQNICEERTRNTYGDRLPNGEKTYGGFSDKWRGDRRWTFKIPDRLNNAEASSFLCAGITAFRPLHRWEVGPKSTVGVMGVGGIGHFGILFAKAMGAKVVALSAGDHKREVAKQLGCDDYLNTKSDEDFARYKNQFTHILCTGTTNDFVCKYYMI
jgi:D-arabinose 1-dehydrogenase-like Zn-dependent alcohol dehydrogenase